MKQKQLLRTLLAAVCLLVGTNAWARTTVTYDFSAWGAAGYSLNWGSTITSINNLNCFELDAIKDGNDNKIINFPDYFSIKSREKNKEYIYLNGADGLKGGSRQSVPFQISKLQAGDVVVFTFEGTAPQWLTTNVNNSGVAVAENSDLVSGTEYTVTGEGTQTITIHIKAEDTKLLRMSVTTSKVFGLVKTYNFADWANKGYSLVTSDNSIDVKYTPVGLTKSATHNCRYITSVMNGETEIQNINSEIAAFGDASNSDNNLRLRTDAGKQWLHNYGGGCRAFVISSMAEGSSVTLTIGTGTIYTISGNLTSDGENAISGGTQMTSGTAYSVLNAGNVNIQIASSSGLSKIETRTPDGLSGNPSISSSDGSATITEPTSIYGSYVYTYYTTDGTEPSIGNGKLYTGAFDFSVGVIKAKSYLITGVASDVVTYASLTEPTITRSTNNSVSITADAGTIYYKYNSDDFIEYKGEITVAADATIYAYAGAEGAGNSGVVSRDVALFPSAGIANVENSTPITSGGGTITRGEEIIVNQRTYSPVLVGGEQWGTNVYFATSNWGFRTNGNWYVNSTSDSWLLMKNMKVGDIIVVNTDYAASNMNNASYTEKYSIGNNRAYTVLTDGDVEIAFKKVNSKTMHYFYGIYAYRHNITGTAIGATDNSTAWKGATTSHVTLKPGDSYRYQFINYTNGGGSNDQNWQLIVANANDDADLLEIRADWWENLHGTPGQSQTYQRGFSSNAQNYWTNVPSKMNGASVDMTVTFTADRKFKMTSTTTAEDETSWTYNYTSDNENNIDLTDNASLTVYLTVAKNWLDITSETQTAVGVTTTAAGKGWATLYTDKGLDFSNVDGLTAYTATIDNSTVKLNKVDDIQANTGVVLKSAAEDATTIYSVPVIASSTTDKGSMTGSATDTQLAENTAYILGINSNTGKAQFFINSAGTIAAGKAYLPVGNGGQAKSLNVVFANDPTGIATVNAAESTQPVKRIVNGQLVIEKNGKKFNAAGAEF